MLYRFFRLPLVIPVSALALSNPGAAQIVITPVGASEDEAFAVTLQSDGKIVLAGSSLNGSTSEIALVRYNSDLTLDTSFDGDGKLTTPIGGTAGATSVTLQSNGKIVAAGFAHNGTNLDFAAVRYNPDGGLDTSFDTDGIVTTMIRSQDREDRAQAVAIQPDGRILAAGISWRTVGDADFAVVRYDSNGSLDPTFNTDGIVTTTITTNRDDGRALALQSDGKMVVTGYARTQNSPAEWDMAVVRYNADGSLDNSFDADGIVVSDFCSPSDTAHAVAIQSDGKIVVAGSCNSGGSKRLAAMRFNPDGSLDTSFDADGIAVTPISSIDDEGFGIAIQSDGKIVVAGSTYDGATTYNLAVVRYNPDGSLDATFDGDGIVTRDIGNFDNYGYATVVQPDGKIVVAGVTFNGTDNDFLLVRLNPDGSVPPTSVKLLTFSARGGDREVQLSWETASELDNLGFRLYRALSEEGPYELATASPIPGLGSSPVGAKYSYRDSGLTNGVRYYYRLEDLEATGRSRLHGPVFATPQVAASQDVGATVRSTEEPGSPALITYGKPSLNAFRVLRQDRAGVILELEIAGFFAEPREDGTVRIQIPGLDFFEADGVSIPAKRVWVEASAGRKVRLHLVKESGVEAIEGLVPSDADRIEVEASERGTVRLARRRPPGQSRVAPGRGIYPSEAARIVSVGFQGRVKKALLELAPLRWDVSSRRLLLARRLVVEVAFSGREPLEETNRGRDGQRHEERGSHRRQAARFYRLVTVERGLYGIGFEEVLGRRGRPVHSDGLRLSRRGEPVPFYVKPNPRSFGPGSTLYFLSEGEKANPYGWEAVYELEFEVAGRPMDEVRGASWGEPQAWYWHREEREENRYYQAGLLEARDLWLWDALLAPVLKSFEFKVGVLPVGSERPRLELWLQGASDLPVRMDHHVRVFLNGTLVGETSWEGKQSHRIELSLPPGLLQGGRNHVGLENVGDTGGAYSLIMLDRFAVTYPRVALGDGENLEGIWSQSGTAEVLGVSSPAHVLDVTEGHPRWVGGVRASGTTVRFPVEAGRRYRVVGAKGLLRPELRRVHPTGLKSSVIRADYVIVGPQEFLEAARPLLELRESQGLAVKAVAVEQVYSEFGYGEPSPQAIQEFVSYAYHHWQRPALRYVVLLGDASYDPKDYLGTGALNHVPSPLVKTTYLWTASDPRLASVNGEDILPDLAIGRLPAASLEEARGLVEKLLAYEMGQASASAAVVLVTDNAGAAGNFPASAEKLARAILSSRPIRMIHLSELGAAATRAAILRAFDEGASLVIYVGHGGIHLWADENIFNTGHVEALRPQSQQPLLLTATCLNGYFHFPYFDSLAEGVLKASGKGAIAAFSPSGLSLNGPALVYHQALLDEILSGSRKRLGDAVLAAQSAYLDRGGFPELLSIYHLLGDPALTLR